MRNGLVIGGIIVLTLIQTAWAQEVWLTKAHDVRRTGQSAAMGPVAIDPGQSWTAPAVAGVVLNVGATVDYDAAYVGSWGLLRRTTGDPDPRTWNKSDGRLYAYTLQTGEPRWDAPAELDLVPRCYDYMDRGPDIVWCGLSPYKGSFYNGTVEGQASIDLSRNVIYLGRGDGRLYALNRLTGEVLWRFVTFNPADPADPDGGGEIIASPLVGPDGNIFVGTWGEGPYETDAVYAVDPSGNLLWRYPSASSLPNRVFASPALSPDGNTIYVSTFRDDEGTHPGTLHAFNRLAPPAATDGERLKWSIDLSWIDMPVQTATIAVGTDGTIYVGGFVPQVFGLPVLAGVTDAGDHAVFKWNPHWIEFHDNAQFTLGVALREEAGVTRRIYATTANLGTSIFNAKTEGTLYAVDPEDGSILGSYDPSDDVPEATGGINSPAIDAAGRVFFGVRGKYGSDPVNGHYFGVQFDAESGSFTRLWSYEVDGYVEWSHPAIGPDGALYVGSSVNQDTDQIRTKTYEDGVVPDGSTPLFYALQGPTSTATAPAPEIPGRALDVSVFPNPFAAGTVIRIGGVGPGSLQVHIRDVLGRTVRRLRVDAGDSSTLDVPWDGRSDAGTDVAPGLYIATIRSSDSADRSGVTDAVLIVKSVH